jgi:hypothetical protein
VYITGRDGATLVIRHGPAFQVLAKNSLDDGFDASAALVEGTSICEDTATSTTSPSGELRRRSWCRF